MFNRRIRKAIGFTMWATCYFKFCPYDWDSKNYRFKRANSKHLILHYLVISSEIFTTIFTYFRFLEMIDNSEPRPFIMSFIYVFARTMEMLCYIQFYFKRHEIMVFANAVFSIMNKDGHENIKRQKSSEKSEKFVWNYTAITVGISSILVFLNPPMHGNAILSFLMDIFTGEDYSFVSFPIVLALLLVNTPCVPHFYSSIILECKNHMDASQPFIQKVPLIILENFLVKSMLQVITFNWTLIFVGSAWVKYILKEIKIDAEDSLLAVRNRSRAKFRKAQTIIRHLNEAFRIYLATSPSVILAALVLLIFSTLRYFEVDVTSYLMYPACTARCIFESYSLLAWAGHVNTSSSQVLQKWRIHAHPKELSYPFNKRFDKSCPKLTMCAGSMYTFENSIVLTTINNCSESTFNLLVVYK